MHHAGALEAVERKLVFQGVELRERLDDDHDVGVIGHAGRTGVQQEFGDQRADDAKGDLEFPQPARQVGDDRQ